MGMEPLADRFAAFGWHVQRIDGHDFSATDAEVVAEILALADGALSEEALADWIRQHSTQRRRSSQA